MKLMTAARALLELLVIVAEGYEKVMTVEELKEASLNEVDFTREERNIFQQRLISAISAGSTKDVCTHVHVSPITGNEYVVPNKAEEIFNEIKLKIEELFMSSKLPSKDIDITTFINIVNGGNIQVKYRRTNSRLSEDQKQKIEECVIEQITCPGFTTVSRLNISTILKDSGISREHYTAVAQYAAKTKRNYGGQNATK